MKTSHCNSYIATIGAFLRFMVAVYLCFMANPVSAADNITEPIKEDQQSPIHITADKLVSDTSANYAEFIGNVKASQGDTVITSDRLTVYYAKSADTTDERDNSQDVISRILAEGNVQIVFDGQVAYAQCADYLSKEQVVVLSGPDTKIASGSNSISGSKITLYRAESRIQVESSSEKPVEAYFYNEENGLALPKINK